MSTLRQLGIQTSVPPLQGRHPGHGRGQQRPDEAAPVTFHYKPEYSDGPRTLQYGLIAEEVAEIYPDLVLHDPQTGQPQTVAYHLVNAMLLNEVQKQHRQMLAQEDRIKTLAEQNIELSNELAALKQQNKELAALKAQVQELSALKQQVGVLTALVAPDRQAATRLAGLIDGPGRSPTFQNGRSGNFACCGVNRHGRDGRSGWSGYLGLFSGPK